MKEVYIVIDKTEFGHIQILDEDTFFLWKFSGHLDGRQVLICDTSKSFIVKGKEIEPVNYQYQLMP